MVPKVAVAVLVMVGLLVGALFLARAGMAPNWSTEWVWQGDVAARVEDLWVGGGGAPAAGEKPVVVWLEMRVPESEAESSGFTLDCRLVGGDGVAVEADGMRWGATGGRGSGKCHFFVPKEFTVHAIEVWLGGQRFQFVVD